MEFEQLPRAALPPAHFGYIATGSDDDRTLIQNHEAYNHYQIRAHRFSDLSRLRTSRSVFGAPWPSPVYLSAVSAMRAFYPDGELAVARAARSRSMQLMLSTGSSMPVEAGGCRSRRCAALAATLSDRRLGRDDRNCPAR
jgi:4-hydroxymandelate oxidase